MTKPLDFYHIRGMQRTSQNLKEDVVKNDFGVRAQPLVSIEPEHIIIDELHLLLLRICDKLLRNLILDTKTLDDKNAVHGEKSDFLGQLTEKIRGCGVSFHIWTKKGTQVELDWSSLTGSAYEKLFENFPSKLCFLIHHDTHDHTVKIWSSFLNLYRFVTLEIYEFSNVEDIFEKCKGWVNDFLALGSLGRKGFDSVTPYMHCLVYHVPFFTKNVWKTFTFQWAGRRKDQ
jgi:hypothetical protein